MSDRLTKLVLMLEKQPRDVFLLYAAAQEYRKAGDVEAALAYFARVWEVDGGYCAAYHHAAQTLAEAGRTPEARAMYERGIVAARAKGDAHAQGEMEGEMMAL